MNGFFEVKTDDFVSVIELVGCSVVNNGDEIEGELKSIGGRDLKNLTQNDIFDAFIHEII
jgi:hypothetical protein